MFYLLFKHLPSSSSSSNFERGIKNKLHRTAQYLSAFTNIKQTISDNPLQALSWLSLCLGG